MIRFHPTLSELARLVAAGGMTPVELVDTALAAAAGAEPALNAYIRLHHDEARRTAAALSRRTRDPHLVLAGLPIAVKDNLDEAGIPTTAGCHAYRDHLATADAPAVARLRGAGAIVVGRTNMHELADGITGENPHHGPVHNPWRRGHRAGGSSGGSAAAVAAGSAAAALGTDTGGSIRIPAAHCGVVGLKPTYGLVPASGVLPLARSLDHVGPLARSVADAAMLLALLAPEAGLDPHAACAADPGRPRVGVIENLATTAHPGIGAAFATALRQLEGAGAVLRALGLPLLDGVLALLGRVYRPEAAQLHAARLAAAPDEFGEAVRRDLERGARVAPAAREQALVDRAAFRHALDAAMDGAALDLLVCPTTPDPARPIGSPNAHTDLRFTCAFNLTGQPAITIPMGLVDGLPVGLQLVGRRGGDERLLCVAAAVERALGRAPAPPLGAAAGPLTTS